jgi:hypothetical protein
MSKPSKYGINKRNNIEVCHRTRDGRHPHPSSLEFSDVMKLPDEAEVPCQCGEKSVKALYIKMLRPQ